MIRLPLIFPPRRRAGVGVATALLMTAAIAVALLPHREVLADGSAGLAFVVPVVVATAIGGAPAAVVAVGAGFVAYNALFTTPYLTLRTSEAGDVLGLVVYVLVGATTATIVTLRQREADEARRREREALALYELSRSFVEGSPQLAVQATVEAIDGLFDVATVAIVTTSPTGDPAGSVDAEVVAHTGAPLSDDMVRRLGSGTGRHGRDSSADPDEHVILLLAGARVMGHLVVVGSVPPSGERLLAVFANNVALALHRAELAAEATRVEVLEETDRVRSALIRSVSHDLRTPLASMVAAGEDLADEGLTLSRKDRRLLARTVAEEGRRLDDLVTNLLDMSRIESGRLDLRPEAIDLRELVDTATAGRTSPDVTVADDLPPVLVDPLLIEQVLRNLIDNATRHGGATSPAVQAVRDGDTALVTVVDRGPGVPDTRKERIFVPFHRVADDSRPSHSGVGLAICKAYVEAHGGTIEVVDTVGGGATFRLRLPLAEPLALESS